jgi:signal transduction histidine kinase
MSGERNRIILDFVYRQAPVFLLLLDKAGTIVDANAYTQALLGETLTAKSIREVFLDFSHSFDLKKFAAKPNESRLLNVRTSTGLPQTFYVRFIDLGDQFLALGMFDHNELESMRKELVELNNELSNLTRELHKKNAELERLNLLKNQFLGYAAHDLRKPIGAIMSYSDFLLSEISADLNDEHRRFLETISSSSGFMKAMVDEFLDIARIESGQLVLDLVPIDFREVIEKSLALNEILARKRGVALSLVCDPNIPRLLVDGAKIEQVLNNLISNAIEHSDPGTIVEIEVSYNGQAVTVLVKDQGPGLTQEDIQKLFRPFARAARRKPSGAKSTGLGLVIARKIIEAHLGKIWVESEIGKGATFGFSIPEERRSKGEGEDEQGITGGIGHGTETASS